MAKDPFYQHLAKHYTWHVVGQFAAIYLLGGLPALLWAGCLRTVWVYHITWFVNSAAHVWGYQDYNTGAPRVVGGWWLVLVGGSVGWGIRGLGQGEKASQCQNFLPAHPPARPDRRPAAAGDQSRNNWWVGILGFGEGWHNNHHAFEFSARHGLKDNQWDMTWVVISQLQRWGLATDVKLPTEKQKARLALDKTQLA